MNGDSRKSGLTIFSAVLLAVLLVSNVVTGMGVFQENSEPDVVSPSDEPAVVLSDLSAITEGLPTSYRSQILESAQMAESVDFTAEELAAITKFYSESAFIGDSLLIGFRTYLQRNDLNACFAKSTMLASYSYSTRTALKPISSYSIHPIYKGEQRQLWDTIQMSGVKRVFLLFWANEIPQGDIAAARRNLEKLVTRIRSQSPNVEIYVASPCYRYNDPESEKKKLTNENLTLLAQTQKEFCDLNGAGYVEVSKYIGNETDGIFEEYTFDKYVHINDEAYAIWKQVFCEYALGREAVINNGH